MPAAPADFHRMLREDGVQKVGWLALFGAGWQPCAAVDYRRCPLQARQWAD